MDPVSAVGVAAASIQFLDFSIKLFSATREISSSASGLTTNQQSILGIASRLESMVQDQAQSLKRLRLDKEAATPARELDEGAAIPPREQLGEICQQCHRKAKELHHAVSAVKTTRASPKVWASFWVALKGVMSEAKLQSLLDELEVARTQLHTTLLVCLWDVSLLRTTRASE